MDEEPNARGAWIFWLGVVTLAAIFRWGPPALYHTVEHHVLSLTANGLAWLPPSAPLKVEANVRELQALRAQNRQLIAQLVKMRDELQHRPITGASEIETAPLLTWQLRQARVLGRVGAATATSLQYLIDLGKQQGLTSDELVLQGNGLLIEPGVLAGLQPDDLACWQGELFGRISVSGRWTSIVQPLTAPDFRIAVQLTRSTPLGPVVGAQGLLVGDGEGCRIEDVPTTESVALGDDVYVAPQLTSGNRSIYCGKVIRAEAAPTATQREIELRPAVKPTSPTQLSILRGSLQLRE